MLRSSPRREPPGRTVWLGIRQIKAGYSWNFPPLVLNDKIVVSPSSEVEEQDSFELNCPNGDVIVVNIKYQWYPLKCSSCKVFGHSDKHCPRNRTVDVSSSKPPAGGDTAAAGSVGKRPGLGVKEPAGGGNEIPAGPGGAEVGERPPRSPCSPKYPSPPSEIHIGDVAAINSILDQYATRMAAVEASNTLGKESVSMPSEGQELEKEGPSTSPLSVGTAVLAGNMFSPLSDLPVIDEVTPLPASSVPLPEVRDQSAPKRGKRKQKGKGKGGAVAVAEHKTFFVSIVYGMNLARERVRLWRDLSFLFPQLGTAAWTILGDFNVVRHPKERVEGFDPIASADFNKCIEDINMQEMVTKGFWFTWSNKRGGNGAIKSRLDRVLLNDAWLDLFRDSEVVGFAPGISDHCALVLTVLPNKFKACPFRFFNFWMLDGRFKGILSSSWREPAQGNPLTYLSYKLKRLKPLLKAFHKQNFNHLSGRVTLAKDNLSKIQDLCFRFPLDNFLCDLEKDLVQQYYSLSVAEESYKKQKSRISWLALGDKNTRFFHHKMNAHRVRNSILSLATDQGVRLEDPNAIEAEILGYFQGLLGTGFAGKWDPSEALHTALLHKRMAFYGRCAWTMRLMTRRNSNGIAKIDEIAEEGFDDNKIGKGVPIDGLWRQSKYAVVGG
ncbi:hypothetical protein Vadar_033759 [Vaccinium darrowii]|uniref:Uncharacterized protein n=1 Tax=Vaccinium darrowii TaxID=229202 RepID=A0ACB7ZPN9_9ERIC|nr:hypothetical protein Vadar_033759 [Vaccinium darrowii]